MKNLTIYKTPFNDNELFFNNDTGRYELTLQCVKNNFDVSFADDNVLQKRITKNSRKIYNFIYYRAYSHNKSIIEFCLNKTEQGRKFLKNVLLEQIEADLLSGYNDLSSQPNINVGSGLVIDRYKLAESQVSVDTELLIDDNSTYFGFNILYQGIFPASFFRLVREQEQEQSK